MAKVRVHELAKQWKIPSKELVTILQRLGLDVKNHMSTLEEEQADWVRRKLEQKEPSAQPEREKTVQAGREQVVEKGVQDAGKPARRPSSPVSPVGEKQVSQPRGRQQSGSHPRQTPAQPARPESVRGPKKPGTGQQLPAGQGQVDSKPRVKMQPRPDRRPSGGSQGQSQTKPGQGQPRPAQGQPRPGQGQPRSAQGQPRAGQGQPRSAQGQPRPAQGESRPAQGQPRPAQGKPGPAGAKPASGQRGDAWRRRTRPKHAKKKNRKRNEAVPVIPDLITVADSISVRELAEKINVNAAEVMKKLMGLGMMVAINQEIDLETAEIVAAEYDVTVEREKTLEEELLQEIVDSGETLKPRPPVVTVMGHVDHGKTSVLDAIRETKVASNEAGGITQHIGAYQVEIDEQKITFIDTPGHEAFTAMRARGAQATDIAILVVAVDDGVMPQTVEAINHARAAGVPIIVALNKIDKPNANPDRVKQQLTEYNLIPEEWGGDTIMVPVSAKSGTGLQQLLEMILLVAEMKELLANPERPAEGVVIEGRLDKGRGPVATILVQKGTLGVGDSLLCGLTWGKVRAMIDYHGKRVEKAPPSFPIEVVGLDEVPMAGDTFRAVDEKLAKQITNLRLNEKKREEQGRTSKISLDDLFKHIQEGEVKDLNLIIKGDVQGSIEALGQSLLRLSNEEVRVNVIHSGVGAVTETDVMLASASNAIIIGFNVRPDSKARKYAEMEDIDVRLYRVIYEAIEDVKKAMAGLLEPEYREVFQGRAEVRAVFKVPKVGNVAGCYMTEGKVNRNSKIRLLRDGVILFEGSLASLKRFKDDVREVVEGYECGIGVEGFNDIKEGDTIESYNIEEIPREL